jgi:hypothetical protein
MIVGTVRTAVQGRCGLTHCYANAEEISPPAAATALSMRLSEIRQATSGHLPAMRMPLKLAI